MIKTIARLFKDYKPLPFFGILGIILAVIAIIMVTPVLVEYSRTGLVPRLPTFVTACFTALFALLSLICGLILDTQNRLARQNYELQMNILYMLEGKRGECPDQRHGS